MDRKAAIEAAILRIRPEGFTTDGKPAVDAINAYLHTETLQLITAKERDALWAERVSEAKDAGAPAAEIEVEEPSVAEHDEPQPAPSVGMGDPGAPEGFTKITLTSAMSDPVPLYVHGVGAWSIRVGETVTLPDDALDALRNSDCTFTQE